MFHGKPQAISHGLALDVAAAAVPGSGAPDEHGRRWVSCWVLFDGTRFWDGLRCFFCFGIPAFGICFDFGLDGLFFGWLPACVGSIPLFLDGSTGKPKGNQSFWGTSSICTHTPIRLQKCGVWAPLVLPEKNDRKPRAPIFSERPKWVLGLPFGFA